MTQRSMIFVLLIFACGLGLCGGEKFNFEVARRTHDNVENFLRAAEFPTQELVRGFSLGILNATSPTFFSDTGVLMSALLHAVPQIGAVYLIVNDQFIAMVQANNMLVTTEQMFNGTCPGGVEEGHMCLNIVNLDEYGNPTALYATEDVTSAEVGIMNSNVTRWSPIRQLTLNTIGTNYARPIYNDDGSQLGTAFAGVMISNLDTFLFNAFGEEPDNRVVYIVERTTGNLVAASVPGVTTIIRENLQPVQVLAVECFNKLIRESSTFLFTIPDLKKEMLYVYNGYYVQSTPYTATGIDWLIVVVRPADIQDDYIVIGSAPYLVMSVICGLCVIVTFCLMGWVIRFRNLRLWKAAQPEALLLILISNLATILGAFSVLGPPTAAHCLFRQWIMSLALFLTSSSLIAKLLRVHIATNSKRIMRRFLFRRLTASSVVAMVAFTILLECIILLVWTLVDPYRPQLQYHTQVGVIVGYELCASDSMIWLVLDSCFGVLTIITGCYLSFVTRNVSELFAESRALMMTFFHGAFIGLVIVLVRIFGNVSVQSRAVFVVVGMLWFTLTTQAMLFLPRIYRQVTLGDFTVWEMKEFLVKHLNRERQFQQRSDDKLFLSSPPQIRHQPQPQPQPQPRVIFADLQQPAKEDNTSNKTEQEITFVI